MANKLALIYSASVAVASLLFKVKQRTALPTTGARKKRGEEYVMGVVILLN